MDISEDDLSDSPHSLSAIITDFAKLDLDYPENISITNTESLKDAKEFVSKTLLDLDNQDPLNELYQK
jgi:hypothetical protein